MRRKRVSAERHCRLKPYLDILKLVWPLALGMVNNAVMQFVDRAYLAHESMASLEAVLPAGMLMWIFAGFFQSVVAYSSVFVAQYHGAGAGGSCRVTYRAAVGIALVSGVLSLPLVPFGDWILALSAPSAAVLAREKSYFDVVMLGAFFVYGQTAAASYFTGRGKTSTVFWVNLFGNALNIAIDPVLIFGWCGCPRLGIVGAAYATVFSMAVQWLALFVAARRENPAPPDAPCAPGMRGLVFRMLRFGVPSGCYNVLNCLSFTIFVFVTGGVGELELAVSNACFTVNYLLFAPMEGFSIGASTLVAQAIGRGDLKAAVRDARRTASLGVGFAAMLSFLALLFAHPVLSLFVSSELAADEPALGAFHSLGFTLFAMMAAWQVFDAADVIVSGALKGAGDTKFVMLWMLFGAFALWLPGVFIVRRLHNTMPALWVTMIAYVVVLCVGTFVRWRCGAWRRIRLV